MNIGPAELILLLTVVLPIWGIIDAAIRPGSQWRQSNQSKVLWVVLQLFLGIVGAIAYFAAIRPKLKAAATTSRPSDRNLMAAATNSTLARWRPALAALTLVVAVVGVARAASTPGAGRVVTQSGSSKIQEQPGSGTDASGAAVSKGSSPSASTGSGKAIAVAAKRAPRPFGAPEPGKYRYKQNFKHENESSSSETTFVYEDKSSTSAELIQTVTEGGGRLIDTKWTSGGQWTTRETLGKGEKSTVCDWEPDILDLQFPLKTGSQWSVDSTCTFQAKDTVVVRHRTGTVKVLGNARVTIAGEEVEAFVIQRNMTETVIYGAVTSTTEVNSKEMFSVKYGLKVQAETHVKGSAAGNTYEFDMETLLVNLAPA